MSISSPPTPGLFIFIFIFILLFRPSFADDDSRLTPPPQPPTSSFRPQKLAPFRPSIAVIVAFLTTMFSITFIILLYAKHCKRSTGGGHVRYGGQSTNPAATGRKNSGIDRTVIESLPLFRFGSLRGQKNGLECAVCLAWFEPAELLRLLPKCKHAFHVECVDTWLDAHSTCPLCRYRVDPEDILLIDDCKILHDSLPIRPQRPPTPQYEARQTAIEESSQIRGSRQVSGRHSSAGEKASGFLEIVVEQPGEQDPESSYSNENDNPASFRRSLDSSMSLKEEKNNSDSVTVGCFDRQRKDGILLADDGGTSSFDRSRFEHRIVISGTKPGSSSLHFNERWSDVHPSDMLYLRSEMIISDSRRFSSAFSGSRPSVGSNGRSVINSRSVSEITGLNRFSNDNSNRARHDRERQAGVVSRWLAWISQSQPVLRSERTTTTVAVSSAHL
ncbi:putative ring finger protein [Tripterygium wilfordii]|uniref:RING-type E3 ubiquitin transferase n=2 Tax=Tripterygium wilfordii TaxID=458696 RepID=A0A7J7DL09_TRIWF|nr:putative ring finger protein [Tripterygium wilfordii]